MSFISSQSFEISLPNALILGLLMVILLASFFFSFPAFLFPPFLFAPGTPSSTCFSNSLVPHCTLDPLPFTPFFCSNTVGKCSFTRLHSTFEVSTRTWLAFHSLEPTSVVLYCNDGNTLGLVPILKGTSFSSVHSGSRFAIESKPDSRVYKDCRLFGLFNR